MKRPRPAALNAELRSGFKTGTYTVRPPIGNCPARAQHWQAEQQRIRDEANRARSEAIAGVPYAPKGETRMPVEKVDPQLEGQPSQEQPIAPEPAPAPKRNNPKAQAKKASTAKAAKMGGTKA